MKSVIAAIAAIAATVVSAQNIVTSQPAANQALTAGSTANIVWAPVDGVISQIDLRKGDQAALSFISTIATSVPASTGSYSWNIDASLPAGTDYALSFGLSPNVTYTPFFSIKAASGAPPASSGAASPSSDAKPSASAAKPSAGSSAAPKASGSASGTASAPSATTSPSAANKNVAAVGVAAVAGAVVAALI